MGLLILRSRSRAEVDLQNVADVASLAVVPRLMRRMQYLPTLAVVAVLLGVLGVVDGLHDALIAAVAAPDRGVAVTSGFAAALGPLALGLTVAIVLVFGRGYLTSQADALTDEVREFSARLINALIDRPDVRLGHR
jgi:biopolymer transport protein ExbB/TolQ